MCAITSIEYPRGPESLGLCSSGVAESGGLVAAVMERPSTEGVNNPNRGSPLIFSKHLTADGPHNEWSLSHDHEIVSKETVRDGRPGNDVAGSRTVCRTNRPEPS